MKEQCNDSGIRDLASEAKSFLRVMESVEQVRWRLEYGKDTRSLEQNDGSILESWAKDCYMDGLTATRTIRALSRPDAKTIPIIAMTANAFKEEALCN